MYMFMYMHVKTNLVKYGSDFVTMNFLSKINSTITEENARDFVLPLPFCSFCHIFLIMMTPNKYLD